MCTQDSHNPPASSLDHPPKSPKWGPHNELPRILWTRRDPGFPKIFRPKSRYFMVRRRNEVDMLGYTDPLSQACHDWRHSDFQPWHGPCPDTVQHWSPLLLEGKCLARFQVWRKAESGVPQHESDDNTGHSKLVTIVAKIVAKNTKSVYCRQPDGFFCVLFSFSPPSLLHLPGRHLSSLNRPLSKPQNCWSCRGKGALWVLGCWGGVGRGPKQDQKSEPAGLGPIPKNQI